MELGAKDQGVATCVITPDNDFTCQSRLLLLDSAYIFSASRRQFSFQFSFSSFLRDHGMRHFIGVANILAARVHSSA